MLPTPMWVVSLGQVSALGLGTGCARGLDEQVHHGREDSIHHYISIRVERTIYHYIPL